MRITFDPTKRERAFSERGLDFADAALVFEGVTLEKSRTSERSTVKCASSVTACLPDGRMVVVGYTPRGADRHVFSMRKANGREKARIAPLLEI